MTRKIKRFISYAILVIASLLSVFPLYYMLSGATNKSIDIVRGRLIPGGYLMENFKTLVANQNLGLAMFNSFRNAILITFISLLVCSIAGYGFEIYHDKGKDTLMSILLLAMMLPFVALMIPLFKMFLRHGTGKQLDRTGTAVGFHAVYDHAVSAGIQILPDRYYRSQQTGRNERSGNLFPYVCTDHEVYLRRSNDSNVYECME